MNVNKFVNTFLCTFLRACFNLKHFKTGWRILYEQNYSGKTLNFLILPKLFFLARSHSNLGN